MSTAGTTSQPFLPATCSRVCDGKREASKTQQLSTLKVNPVGSIEPQDRQVESRAFSLTEQEGTADNGR